MTKKREINGYKLLNEIHEIRNIPVGKRRGRKNESFNDYIIRKSNYTCYYCKRTYPKQDLCVVRKNMTDDGPNKEKNRICSCKYHVDLKGTMDHIPFLKFLESMKKKQREEIVEVYKVLAPKVFAKYNHKCIYCTYWYAGTGKAVPKRKLTLDHKVPLIRGGTNDEGNLAPACYPCNKKKDDLTAGEYFEILRKKKENYTQRQATR